MINTFIIYICNWLILMPNYKKVWIYAAGLLFMVTFTFQKWKRSFINDKFFTSQYSVILPGCTDLHIYSLLAIKVRKNNMINHGHVTGMKLIQLSQKKEK